MSENEDDCIEHLAPKRKELKDHTESNPLNPADPLYKELKDIMEKAIDEHKKSIVPVASQFSYYRRQWKPWLQPCCNFPYCSCTDPKYTK